MKMNHSCLSAHTNSSTKLRVSCLIPDNKDVSVMMREMDVNAIAGTLKLYFRELPEPLFTDELYPNFAGGIGPFVYNRTFSNHKRAEMNVLTREFLSCSSV